MQFTPLNVNKGRPSFKQGVKLKWKDCMTVITDINFTMRFQSDLFFLMDN